ncbi:response regulator receiver protein [Chondrocystis sp. NIES-4102]|nr:response regulator receiver protein [Chondrocystis sp. NIES-4102]
MTNKRSANLDTQLIHLKQKQFTGHLNIESSDKTLWRIYLCLGRLVWADGGVHPHRSWKRLIDTYCPKVDWYISRIDFSYKPDCGDYQALKILLEQKLIEREQAIELVKTRATEILFDLLQVETTQQLIITSEVASTSSFLTSGLQMSISLVNVEQVLQDAKLAWLTWHKKGLAKWSPNFAPVMRKQERLKEEVPGIVYQNFLKLLDGQSTLRDLSSRMGKDVRKLTSSLVPYVDQQLLNIIAVDDIAIPQYSQQLAIDKETADLSRPLIACIDDSPQICKIMEKIITQRGYRYLSIQESLQAVPSLIKANPDFIFLDIGMPIVNGYEICTQVRRVAKLKNIPIVFLTGNDGIVDRVRAKVSGANAFITKPVEVDKIISTINKHIVNNSEPILGTSQLHNSI